jgi:hypothetical protein
VETPAQVLTFWQNRILQTPDPANNGRMSPGLAGRLYVYGPDLKYPIPGDGGVVIELYDEDGREPVFVERWEIDPVTFKRLLKQDMLGWGYTVFLPLVKDCRPDMSKVRLRVRYQPGPSGSAPLFREDQMTLAATNGRIDVQTTTTR